MSNKVNYSKQMEGAIVISWTGDDPTIFITLKAILLCNPQNSIPRATITPPGHTHK